MDALTTTPKLAGKALGVHSEFSALKRKVAALCKKKLSGWQVLDVSMEFARLEARRLDLRIDELLAELRGDASVSARATPEKSLRLRLVRAINEDSVRPLVEKIEGAHGRAIKLTIMSEGGHVFAARRLADAIARHGAVDTHAVVNCDSAATLVFAAGRRRSALKGCTLLFHRPSIEGPEAHAPGAARRLDKVAKDMAAFMAKRTGGKPAAFLKLMTTRPTVIDAGQASLMGLVNDVVRRPHNPKKGKRS
jgi:ATP-dependent protease ClpP protease subunit